MNPDFILEQDKKQSITKADAARSRERAAEWDADPVAQRKAVRPIVLEHGVYCRREDHGLMGVHKSGIALICGKCDHQHPVSIGGENAA